MTGTTHSAKANPLPQELLVMYRQRSGLTQVQLAERLDLKSERMVQNWEGGYGLPKPARLRKIIELYLELGIFIKGHETEEARQLWESVKNLFDTNSPNFEIYQIFDRLWFESLLKARAPSPVPAAGREISGLESLGKPLYNLPAPPNQFIGRQQEVRTVCELLERPYVRLVSLTGPGGIGKTRLGLEIAAKMAAKFRDGICLVELAALTDSGLVGQAVALGLGLREEPGRPFQAILGEYLATRQLLLFLDNTEHLIEACALLADGLLRICPGLKILATSRESFNLTSEVPFRLASLRLPPHASQDGLDHNPNVEELYQYEALQLFVERAGQAQPGFELTQANAPAVVQVCRLLDGIPLGLELAASRLRMLSIEEIALRLDNAFSLLAGKSRAVLPRQQTMRASLDWSFDLLAGPERAVLRRLAIFRGGCTLEAAEAVCAGGEVDSDEVLDILDQLVNKSLVLVEEDESGHKRLRLLEILKQYLSEKLIEAGELILTCNRHLDYYLKIAEEASPKTRGPEQLQYFEKLEKEHDNFHGTFEWSLEHRDNPEFLEKGLRLANSLYWFWFVRGFESEGRVWLEKLLQASGESVTAQYRAEALVELVIFSWGQHDYDTAMKASLEAERLYNQVGDKQGVAIGRGCDGIVLFSKGEFERGQQLLDEALAVMRHSSDRWFLGHFIYLKATTHLRLGQFDRASALYQESLAVFQQEGDWRWQGWVLYSLGHIRLYQKDFAQAETLLQENLKLFRLVGDRRGIPWSLQSLGSVMLERQDYAQAEALLHESLLKHWQQLTRGGIVCTLEWLVVLAERREQWERAALLGGAAESLRKNLSGNIMQAIRAGYASSLEKVKNHLGESEFETQSLLGQGMRLEQVISWAVLDK